MGIRIRLHNGVTLVYSCAWRWVEPPDLTLSCFYRHNGTVSGYLHPRRGREHEEHIRQDARVSYVAVSCALSEDYINR